MSENNNSGAPRSSSAVDALADLKKQRRNSTSYNRPPKEPNNNNISGAPHSSRAADALADLKKQRRKSTSYTKPSNQSNNNNSDDDGCSTVIFWIIGIFIGIVLFSMM